MRLKKWEDISWPWQRGNDIFANYGKRPTKKRFDVSASFSPTIATFQMRCPSYSLKPQSKDLSFPKLLSIATWLTTKLVMETRHLSHPTQLPQVADHTITHHFPQISIGLQPLPLAPIMKLLVYLAHRFDMMGHSHRHPPHPIWPAKTAVLYLMIAKRICC